MPKTHITSPQTGLITKQSAAALLPKLSPQDNKTTRGKSLLIAGSAEYPGAGILAGRAALRAGSGYALLALDEPSFLSADSPDLIVIDLNMKDLKDLEFTAVGIGPGAGVGPNTEKRLRQLVELSEQKVVVDADALTTLAQHSDIKPLQEWILTPHEGELARLMGVNSAEIKQKRQDWIQRAQEKFNCIIVLKGHRTLIAAGNILLENTSGNSALAKSGTGDVLTGIITALRAQGLDSLSAAALGVYGHGKCAELWCAQGKDALSLLASDLIEILPEAFFQLRKSTAHGGLCQGE